MIIAEPLAGDEVWEWLGDGWVVLWTHAGICVGTVKGGEVTWLAGEDWAELPWADHLVELRAFNAQKEWRLWRSRNGVKGRKRQDLPVENGRGFVRSLDSSMNLRGVVAEPWQATFAPETPKLMLKTRNYLGVNGFGTSEFTDVRFVEIINNGGGK